MGSDLPVHLRSLIFVGFNSCAAIFLGAFLFWNRQASWQLFVSFLCILAGALGNLIDRIANDGLVTDFMNVGVGPIRTGVFNVADMAVMFGCIAIVLCSIRDQPIKRGDRPLESC